AGIARAVMELTGKAAPDGLKNLLTNVTVTDKHKAIAAQLNNAGKKTILLGNLAHCHPAFSTLRALAGFIANAAGATLGYLTEGANSAGAWIAGAVPHRSAGGKEASASALNARSMFESPLKAYLLLNIEPEYDCADPASAIRSLNNADFVVSLSPYRSSTMAQYASVLLPITPFSETSGTYVNAEGLWQSFAGAVKPLGEARPAWKVLRVLGNFFGLDGFEYVSSNEVRDELANTAAGLLPSNTVQWHDPVRLSGQNTGLTRIADVPIYAVDNIVRRAASLQKADPAMNAGISVNEATARRLGLDNARKITAKQGTYQVMLSLSIDNRIPDDCVLLPMAITASTGMGVHTGPIELGRG
ncbi:MAG TPA: molybdopterin-dependent oxidoreductase, partial [Gammaproteobacteria bacterium]